MGFINSTSAASVLQLANDTLGKMYNRYIDLKLAGGAYDFLENSIVIINSYIDALTPDYQNLANTDSTYQTAINNLYNIISLQEYTPYTYGDPIDEGFQYTLNQTSNIYDGFTSVTTYTPNRFLMSNKFGYPVASDIDPSIFGDGAFRQTEVVFPTEGVSFYVFTDLIGKTVDAVYRGTSTILRVRSIAPDNTFAQFNITTGRITVNYPFGTDESLWVQYRSLT